LTAKSAKETPEEHKEDQRTQLNCAPVAATILRYDDRSDLILKS